MTDQAGAVETSASRLARLRELADSLFPVTFAAGLCLGGGLELFIDARLLTGTVIMAAGSALFYVAYRLHSRLAAALDNLETGGTG